MPDFYHIVIRKLPKLFYHTIFLNGGDFVNPDNRRQKESSYFPISNFKIVFRLFDL